MDEKTYWVYIMSNKARTTLYTGITNSLERRVSEHKNKTKKGFTEKYNLSLLVYYEAFERVESAIQREKRIKKWNRQWKDELISTQNPSWTDLSLNWDI